VCVDEFVVCVNCNMEVEEHVCCVVLAMTTQQCFRISFCIEGSHQSRCLKQKKEKVELKECVQKHVVGHMFYC